MIQQHSLQVVESKNVTVNGLSALAMVADQVDEQNNQTIRIMTYLISYNGLIYTFHGLSLKESFDTYVRSFSPTMRGFKVLNDQAKINVKPEVIDVMTVSRSMTLQNFLKSNKVPENRIKEHAILNSMELNQSLSTGTMIKIITK